VLLRTEVIAYNRLHSHRQPQYNQNQKVRRLLLLCP
jgi:hypothetical protein